MISLHERMLPDLVGSKLATSWSTVKQHQGWTSSRNKHFKICPLVFISLLYAVVLRLCVDFPKEKKVEAGIWTHGPPVPGLWPGLPQVPVILIFYCNILLQWQIYYVHRNQLLTLKVQQTICWFIFFFYFIFFFFSRKNKAWHFMWMVC